MSAFYIVHFLKYCLNGSSPYLLKHAEPDPYINGEHLVASSSKLIVIDKLLADVLPHGEQVLIFSVRRNVSESKCGMLIKSMHVSNGHRTLPLFSDFRH